MSGSVFGARASGVFFFLSSGVLMVMVVGMGFVGGKGGWVGIGCWGEQWGKWRIYGGFLLVCEDGFGRSG